MPVPGTASATDDRRPPAGERVPRRVLIALCATQITSWGVLFYALPVLLADITADTGWSTAAVMGAFSIGLGASALAGIWIGHLLDRRGPRLVMTAGSVAAVLAVVGIATAPNLWWFTAAWVLSGVAQAAVLYKPAFAAITVWYGARRVRALTIVTLAGGLASTVFAPLTAFVNGHFDWRGTYLVLAVVLAALTVPAHAIALDPPWPAQPLHAGREAAFETPALDRRRIITSPGFVALAAAIALTGFAMGTSNLYLVPLMTGRGMDTTVAAWALGLCGAGQLLGRIAYAPIAIRTGPTVRAVAILGTGAAMLLATALIAGPVPLVFATVVLLGAARGAFTLLDATVITDRWGPQGYATLHGILTAPATVALALSPWAGAHLAAWTGGTAPMFTLLAALAGVATLIVLAERIMKRRN
ncbi:MFS transporter [Glycomyces terrestris]|uniref:MFS transporter n=1 Tax=Glycomyces terrestris TaxID=2493553 RepID=A0A426V360_9ACTN|nr:MFS transporter [Glycomyces terrestris]RRS01296.1 MFS transporter [Glycomyces terrestris]